MTTGRVLARDEIAGPLSKKLVEKAQHLPVGDPMTQVALGPIINRAQVERIHAIVKDTVAAGATLKRPVEDQFYGDRAGSVEDPFGHVWHLATHVEDVSHEEIARRGAALAEGQTTGQKP